MIGALLLVIPLAVLLVIGLGGLGNAGILGGAGFFGAIYMALYFCGIIFFMPMGLGLVLVCIPRR